jgi:predicted pyridoxine 5'-phosphate oxidase superfamily flavin-nucleotide-binding protein
VISNPTAGNTDEDRAPLTLGDIASCFEGVIPAVVATAGADGMPNITYISKVHRVDGERVALSNQFLSKTARNLAENPRLSLLLVDPLNYDQYRLSLVYERTERRGPVFERLNTDVDTIAALTGMQDVFKLRSADVYRVVKIEQVLAAIHREDPERAAPRVMTTVDTTASALQLAHLTARLNRCQDLDTLVSVALAGLAELLGYEHTFLMLLDEDGTRLYTIASHGYDAQGVGSEIPLGEGLIGMAAARCAPLRVGNLHQMVKYSKSVRRAFEEHGIIGPGHEIPVPGLAKTESRIAVPAMVLGQLVGVLVAESPEHVLFGDADEAILSVVAGVVASAIEIDQAHERAETAAVPKVAAPPPKPVASRSATRVRFFEVDGSVFLDSDYLIKGVAGRILWVLLGHYERDRRDEFSNKEVRLELASELPDFRDNLESRLILLKRRLDERGAPIRIEKTGRARFRVVVSTPLELDSVSATETP